MGLVGLSQPTHVYSQVCAQCGFDPSPLESTLHLESGINIAPGVSIAPGFACAQVVSEEEGVAAGEAAKVQAIKDECEADLAEALPALQAAVKALDTLTKNDITEVKGMKSPPAGEGCLGTVVSNLPG